MYDIKTILNSELDMIKTLLKTIEDNQYKGDYTNLARFLIGKKTGIEFALTQMKDLNIIK